MLEGLLPRPTRPRLLGGVRFTRVGWGSIFNCVRMVMLGGVVLVISKAYVLMVMVPPITVPPKREPEKPRPPPRTGLLHVHPSVLNGTEIESLNSFFWTQCERSFLLNDSCVGDVGKERPRTGGTVPRLLF